MKVLIAGSSGMIGAMLLAQFEKEGHETVRLVRPNSPHGGVCIEWDPSTGSLDHAQLEGFDAVINLAGESIGEGRWNEAKKKCIRDSRINSTSLLSRALAQLIRPPRVFISMSAIGYYGDRGSELLKETALPGNDFLAGVCKAWEEATDSIVEKRIRVVLPRLGFVLSRNGGGLAKMLTPFKLGLGGVIGRGQQYMSWISIDDVIGIIRFALLNEKVKGPVNAVSPTPVWNKEFTRALGKALHRPVIFPMPAFVARSAFGEMADALLLSSQRVSSETIERAGYVFKHPTLELAFRDVLA